MLCCWVDLGVIIVDQKTEYDLRISDCSSDVCSSDLEIIPRESFVLSDLPHYGTAAITVTVTGASTVGIGNLLVGPVADFGLTDFGMKLGIIDYSLKNKDDFGITGLVERGYASTQDATIFVARSKRDYMFKQLASLRSTLAVYFDDSGYASPTIHGLPHS